MRSTTGAGYDGGMGTEGVHGTATAFSEAADVYEQARPGYPPEVLAWLGEHAGIGPGVRVLDLAAGTGKLTRGLVALRAAVVAVEPVAGMRRALAAAVAGTPVVAGVAQAIPLGTGTVDACTVAQAFHWFATESAVAELHRVLRPGGALAVVWNRRELSDPLQADLQRLMAPLRGDAPSLESGLWRAALEGPGGGACFTPGAHFTVDWRQPIDVDGVADRVASVSFVASLAEPERAGILEQARAAARSRPAPLALPYTAEVTCYRRRD